MRVPLAVLLACAVPLASGCGTAVNLSTERRQFLTFTPPPEPRVYGGVRNDLQWIATPFRDEDRLAMTGNYAGAAAEAAAFSLDLPFSLIGDTVTLPVVLYRQAFGWINQPPNEARPSVPPSFSTERAPPAQGPSAPSQRPVDGQ